MSLSSLCLSSNLDAWALVNAAAEVPFLTDDRVCTVGRVLRDNAGGEEEVVEGVEIMETLVVEEVDDVVEIVEEIVVVEGVEIVE